MANDLVTSQKSDRIANKHMKRCSISTIGDVQMKTEMGYHCKNPERPKLKRLIIPSADKDVEPLEPSNIDSGIVHWNSYSEKYSGSLIYLAPPPLV